MTRTKSLNRFWTKLLLAAALLFPGALQALDNRDYQQVIEEFSSLQHLQPYFRHAYGYAVFPAVGKGAAGLGLAYGEGRVYRSHKYYGNSTLSQLSAGLQIGGQVFSEIIFFQDRTSFETFTGGTFELDATASAVAVTLGAQMQVGTTGSGGSLSSSARTRQTRGRYLNGMALFTRIRGGLMYELSVAGQRFNFERAPRRH
jgi:lipid-binding SYLF domain-containing protein